ncbi:MAG TPA: ATP-binding protein [Candidatus Parcubacteria bacterium]|nr:ATP-binding protein [Candidatus Parcubacteria bacterium]
MIIGRDLIQEVKIFLGGKEYLAIIGPRQSGKTILLSLIKKCLIEEKNIDSNDIRQITFEDRILLNQFNDDAIAFVKSYKNKSKKTLYLMIDEFQYSESGGQKLKLIYDTIENVKIIITGSSSLDIKAQVGKYMVGRILTFHLYPFNFGEFLIVKNQKLDGLYRKKNKEISNWLFENKKIENFHNKKDIFAEEFLKLFENFCVWGGYPRVVLSKTETEKRKILNDIYNNYILKDIKGLLELATDKNLLDLSRFLSAQAGNILVYKNLSQVAKLDYRQTLSHLEILRETFIIDLVRPFFKNRQKELSKNPKVYFFDTGFRNSLIENMNSFSKRSDVGAMAENIVFLKLKALFNDLGRINFWRAKAGAEVDFVVDFNGEIFPIEVKFSGFEKASIPRSFMSFVKNFKAKRGLVLTKDYFGFAKTGSGCEVLFYPIYYF